MSSSYQTQNEFPVNCVIYIVIGSKPDHSARDLQAFSRVLPTSRVGYHAGKPIESVLYCLNTNSHIVLALRARPS